MEISIPVFKLYRQLKLLKKQDCVVLPLSLYGQSDNVISFDNEWLNLSMTHMQAQVNQWGMDARVKFGTV